MKAGGLRASNFPLRNERLHALMGIVSGKSSRESAMIKAAIFDWGGVLIENPTEGILQYSRKVLGIGAGCMLAAYRKLIPYFQEGRITEEEFWKGVRRRTGAKRADACLPVARRIRKILRGKKGRVLRSR